MAEIAGQFSGQTAIYQHVTSSTHGLKATRGEKEIVVAADAEAMHLKTEEEDEDKDNDETTAETGSHRGADQIVATRTMNEVVLNEELLLWP